MLKLCNSVAKIMKQQYKETLVWTLLQLETSKRQQVLLNHHQVFQYCSLLEVHIQSNSEFLLKFVTSHHQLAAISRSLFITDKKFLLLRKLIHFTKKKGIDKCCRLQTSVLLGEFHIQVFHKKILWFPDTASTKCFYR